MPLPSRRQIDEAVERHLPGYVAEHGEIGPSLENDDAPDARSPGVEAIRAKYHPGVEPDDPVSPLDDHADEHNHLMVLVRRANDAEPIPKVAVVSVAGHVVTVQG